MEADRIIDHIAAGQHGVFTTAQTAAAGVHCACVERRSRAGLLTRVHRGVYRRGPIASPRWREMAAVLACGGAAGGPAAPAQQRHRRATGEVPPSAAAPLPHHRSALVAVCRESAATMLSLRVPVPSREVCIAVPTGRTIRRSGIRIYASTDLRPSDVIFIEGIPVTSPARTIGDLASALDSRALERLIGDAVQQRAVMLSALEEDVARRKGRRGMSRLAQLLAVATSPRFTRSQLEADAVALVTKGGLAAPRVNDRVAGLEVDLHWPRQRLIIELDGAAFHASFHAQATDRRRDAALVAAGYRVMRFTWRDVHETPCAMLVRVAQALSK